jgi:hypothetical protein
MQLSRERIFTISLACGLVLVLSSLAAEVMSSRLPGNHQGYAPEQPIAFSHRLHAGELGVDCSYCHGAAEQGRHAGIPSPDLCMNCHRSVTAPRADVLAEAEAAKEAGRDPQPVQSPEIAKIYEALGLNEQRLPDPAKQTKPIEWVAVHRLPDFVSFDHRSHIAADVACQKCHGPVESMERVRQHSTLLMGWCIDCHRVEKATLDCGACHQ